MKDSPFTIVYRVHEEEEDRSLYEARGDTPRAGGALTSKRPRAKEGAAKKSVAMKSAARKRGAKGTSQASTKKRGAKSQKAGSERGAGDAGHSHYLDLLGQAAPDLADAIGSLNPKLGRTLLASSFAPETGQDISEAISRLSPVIEAIRQGGQAVTVAILDIDTRVGRLPYVIERLNAAQSVFTFFDLQAPLPAGLVIRSDRFDSWARHRVKVKRVSARDREEFQHNLMFNDFYKYARVVRKTAGVDYLVGITQYMVAGEEEGEYYWNYFSTASKHVILVSAYDLREYAREAGRPFEAAVAGVMLAQLLAEMNKKVKYHDDRGCLFDMNVSRVSIVESLKQGRIEPDCLSKIDPKYRQAAEVMVAALRDYVRPEDPAATPAKTRRAKHDDSYWLDQLNRLSEKLKKVDSK